MRNLIQTKTQEISTEINQPISNNFSEVETLINGIKTCNKVQLIAERLNKEILLIKENIVNLEKQKIINLISKENEQLSFAEKQRESTITHNFEEWKKLSKAKQDEIDNKQKELANQIQELKTKINQKNYVLSTLSIYKIDFEKLQIAVQENKVIQELKKNNKVIFEKYFTPISKCTLQVQNEALEECKNYAEHQEYATRELKKNIYKEIFTKAYNSNACLYEISLKLNLYRKSKEEFSFDKCFEI